MKDSKKGTDLVSIGHGSLWGMYGGQLEYVGQRTEMRKRDDGRWYPVMILRFTDHDVQAIGNHEDLVEGQYYEFEVPIYQG